MRRRKQRARCAGASSAVHDPARADKVGHGRCRVRTDRRTAAPLRPLSKMSSGTTVGRRTLVSRIGRSFATGGRVKHPPIAFAMTSLVFAEGDRKAATAVGLAAPGPLFPI